MRATVRIATTPDPTARCGHWGMPNVAFSMVGQCIVEPHRTRERDGPAGGAERMRRAPAPFVCAEVVCRSTGQVPPSCRCVAFRPSNTETTWEREPRHGVLSPYCSTMDLLCRKNTRFASAPTAVISRTFAISRIRFWDHRRKTIRAASSWPVLSLGPRPDPWVGVHTPYSIVISVHKVILKPHTPVMSLRLVRNVPVPPPPPTGAAPPPLPPAAAAAGAAAADEEEEDGKQERGEEERGDGE